MRLKMPLFDVRVLRELMVRSWPVVRRAPARRPEKNMKSDLDVLAVFHAVRFITILLRSESVAYDLAYKFLLIYVVWFHFAIDNKRRYLDVTC